MLAQLNQREKAGHLLFLDYVMTDMLEFMLPVLVCWIHREGRPNHWSPLISAYSFSTQSRPSGRLGICENSNLNSFNPLLSIRSENR